MSGLVGLLGTLAWWVSVIGSYVLARDKGRNRLVWTVCAMFVPVVTLIVVWLLPPKVRDTYA